MSPYYKNITDFFCTLTYLVLIFSILFLKYYLLSFLIICISFFVSKHLYLTTLKSSCVKSCLNGRFSCLNGHKSAVSIFLQVFLLLQLLYFHAVLCQMCHAIFLHCFSRCLSLFHVALTLTCCSSQN